MNTYYNLGTHTRKVTTDSPHAQAWFDRGLNWLYGFNFTEAARCFQKAIAADRACAMAYWGLAYAHGPYINKQWSYYTEQALATAVESCYDNSRKALGLGINATPAEQALIAALTMRFQEWQADDLATLDGWSDAYADAMRNAYEKFPADLDIIALFVEAMMMRTPWKMWNIATGEVAEKADTLEMMQVLAAGQQLIDDNDLPPHPGLLHMHIHTMEMSWQPEKALRSADMLRGLVPDAGHLLHMPGHIYALSGHYYDAVDISRQAIAADQKFLKQTGPFTRYTLGCCHNRHLMMRTSMFLGQYKTALEAADGITDLLSDEVLDRAEGHVARSMEGYYSMKMHVHVRFGKWQEIIDEPLPKNQERHVVTTAMYRYARAIAYATLGQHDSAEKEKVEFTAAFERIPETFYFFNNITRNLLQVGAAMMDGELAYHRGDYDEAFEKLRLAVTRNDQLNYSEPWPWMHPPRHALGALLLAQGHVEEAEIVYREDLGFDTTIPRALRHPSNVWGLHGYAECLDKLGKSAELAIVQPQLALAQARTETPITSSCACRVEESCCH